MAKSPQIPKRKIPKQVSMGPSQSRVSPLIQRGFALHQEGKLEEARAIYEEILKLEPTHFDALQLLGTILLQFKNYLQAVDLLTRALELNPQFASGYYNRGNALKSLGRLHEAIESYQKAIILQSDYAEALNNCGVCLQELKDFEGAIASFKKALELKPSHAPAYNNLGNALRSLKEYEEALINYEMAIRINKSYAEPYNNRGLTLLELSRFKHALASYDHAIAINPNYAEAHHNRGVILQELNRFDEAIDSFENAFRLNPDLPFLHGNLQHAKMLVCNWTDFDNQVNALSNKIFNQKKVSSSFSMLGLIDSPEVLQFSAKIYSQEKYPLNPILGQIPKRVQGQRIRVGYFSADYRNHAVSILTAELYELHDNSKFELIAFSFGADDQSPIRARIEQAFDQFIDVSKMSDKEIAQLSRKMGIDIAVDLGGHTFNSRTNIFAYRAAPIQVSYIGYLGTMGSSYFDYLIADDAIIPSNMTEYYSEKIAYIPSYQVNDSHRKISEKSITRELLGIPKDAFVFTCFNNNYKTTPDTFSSWMRILKAVDRSVLYLYADNEWAHANLKEETRKSGVDLQRVLFGKRLPTDQYLARYRTCDLFLDTTPYNAGTTASDALWTGLPVLTLIGQSFASRVAASLLRAIDLPELITHTREEYEALAIELATQPHKLAAIKQKLSENRLTTPLFDTPRFTKHLEAAYTQMMERYWADLPPEHIDVGI